MRRIVVALIAMFSAAMLAVTAAPADARDTSISSRDTAATATSDTAERGRIQLTIHHEIVNNTRLKINGQARGWRSKIVLLQRKRGQNGAWRIVERDRTTRLGRYVFASAPVPGGGAHYFFRTKVNSPRYAPSRVIGSFFRE